MCLLFFVVLDDPKPDEYRLVLVNNRDESWLRSTKPASFWGPEQAFISGQDQEPGREGGTWLGIGKNGHLGCLLNIFGEMNPKKKGRGFLVNNFICGSDSVKEYLHKLEPAMHDYNGFHLVLLQISKETGEAGCLCNCNSPEEDSIKDLPSNVVHGFGNSILKKPWQKTLAGKKKFSQIIEKHPTVQQQTELVSELMDMMADRTQHLPDPVLEERSRELSLPEGVMQERSGICVWSPSIHLGSRTTTVILVTADGCVHYYERDLQTCPVDPSNPQYTTQHFQFHLDDSKV